MFIIYWKQVTLKKQRNKEKFGIKFFRKLKYLQLIEKYNGMKDIKRCTHKKIKKSHVNVRIIKILDKMDNLFLLSKNKDLDIKRKYIKEIKTYVLPMVKITLPKIFKYFNNLVLYNYKKIQNEKKY